MERRKLRGIHLRVVSGVIGLRADWLASWMTISVVLLRRLFLGPRSARAVVASLWSEIRSEKVANEVATSFWEDANVGWVWVYGVSLAGCLAYIFSTGVSHSDMEIGLATFPAVVAAGGFFKSYVMAARIEYPRGLLHVTIWGNLASLAGVCLQFGAIMLLRSEGRAFL